jgi:hypothetical protein
MGAATVRDFHASYNEWRKDSTPIATEFPTKEGEIPAFRKGAVPAPPAFMGERHDDRTF